MQTQLDPAFRATPAGAEADDILRKCVHCGFCTAVCPTYQVLGDERDGPRGRIYLIKQMLEGQAVTARTQTHLDRCLSCRACETVCPSGVAYTRLLDIGRAELQRRVPRPASARAVRWLIREGVSRPQVLKAAVRTAARVRGVLPQALVQKLPPSVSTAGGWPAVRHARRWAVLSGCAQAALAPSINIAAARVLDAVGVSLIDVVAASCCGALHAHTDDVAGAQHLARKNIDAWWAVLERSEIEGVIFTASGCGVQLKDYPHLLAADERYRHKAQRLSEVCRDVSEVVLTAEAALREHLAAHPVALSRSVAIHTPCTLQHGLKLQGGVAQLLELAGYTVLPAPAGLACCGSAGSYSLLQSELAQALRTRKLTELNSVNPDVIVSANIGCITHLSSADGVPVQHWIELLAERLSASAEPSPHG